MGDRSLSVFVGNLAFETIPSDLEDLFKDLNIESVRLVRDRETDKFKGYGYVEFKDKESVEEALKRAGVMVLGREVNISLPRQREDRRPQRDNNRPSYNNQRSYGSGERSSGYQQRDSRPSYNNYEKKELPTQPPYTAFVGNFDFNATETDLEGLFDGLEIESIRVIRDRETNLPKGHGYIDFKTLDSLEKALTLNGEEWGGRTLRVDVANQKKTNDFSFARRGQGEPAPFTRNTNRNVERPGEFKVLSAEEEEERKRFMVKPKTSTSTSTSNTASAGGADKKKEDPFGGAKPRDEDAFRKRMAKLSVNESK